MKVTTRFSDVPQGMCFKKGGAVRKKIDEETSVSIGKGGKVKQARMGSDDSVQIVDACPLKYLGVGLRRHPETVVEIGRTEPRRRTR